MRAVYRRRFPVDRFIAKIAASELALLPIFLLLPHDSLRCPLTTRPLAADLYVGGPADVDRFVLDRVAGSGCAAIAENARHRAINVSRDGHDLVHSVVNRLTALGRQRCRADQRYTKCEYNFSV